MDLAVDTITYQALLEAVRAHPEDKDLVEYLVQARQTMETSWRAQQDLGTTTSADGGIW